MRHRQAAALLRTFETLNQTRRSIHSLLEPQTKSVPLGGKEPDLHAARLALLGQLLASIVHEIRQPTAAIAANASAALVMLERRAEPSVNELVEILSDIRDEAMSISEIIDRVRALARKEPLRQSTLNLQDVVDDALKLVRPQASRHGVSLHTEIAAGLPNIIGDSAALVQLLSILVINGIEALDAAKCKERLILVKASHQKNKVEVAVSDTGPGLPAHAAERLFESFVTTKQNGLGLGLPMARLIAEAHGGVLRVNRGSLGGAQFSVMLPVAGNQ